MAAAAGVGPVGDLPNEIGKSAACELSLDGITGLEQVARLSREDLLAVHGVGPKAIRILDGALAEQASVATIRARVGSLRAAARARALWA